MAEIGRAVDQHLHFEPSTSERTFNMRISDYFTACLIPRVCVRVRAEAPHITIVVQYLGEEPERLEPGEIQLICMHERRPGYKQHCLMQTPYAVAMRKGHSAAAEPMTIDRLLSLPYVRVANASIGLGHFDAALLREGKSRWIAATVPALSAVFPIIAHSDLCAILPERWVELYTQPGKLTTLPIPLADLQFTENMVWKTEDGSDPGHRWLRSLIKEEFGFLYSPDARLAKPFEVGPDLLDRIPVKVSRE